MTDAKQPPVPSHAARGPGRRLFARVAGHAGPYAAQLPLAGALEMQGDLRLEQEPTHQSPEKSNSVHGATE